MWFSACKSQCVTEQSQVRMFTERFWNQSRSRIRTFFVFLLFSSSRSSLFKLLFFSILLTYKAYTFTTFRSSDPNLPQNWFRIPRFIKYLKSLFGSSSIGYRVDRQGHLGVVGILVLSYINAEVGISLWSSHTVDSSGCHFHLVVLWLFNIGSSLLSILLHIIH